MKTGLRQRQVQLQKLSPQQIQLMKLLQVPTVLLEQRIKEEMEINPVLEEGEAQDADEFSGEEMVSAAAESGDSEEGAEESREIEDYVNDYMDVGEDGDSYKTQGDQGYVEEEERQVPMAVERSFHEYLEQQLGLMEFESAQDLEIAKQIIGSIDDDGYLRREPVSIADDLLFTRNMNVEEEDILRVLKKIQRMEPPGVGARDLQECLAIQLNNLAEISTGDEDDVAVLTLHLAQRVIGRYFEAFSKKHYEKLQRSLGISEDQLKGVIRLILKLNPKPSSAYSGDQSSVYAQYIIPDFVVYNRDGELELTLNARNAPDLRVSDYFKEMLRNYAERKRRHLLTRQEKEAAHFIKQKIEAARWFIDAIRQRHETMFKAMYAVLQLQKEYFLTGDEKRIRPMILQDISDLTGLDVSTVSRVANSKFVQTEYGTRRLKEFFSEAMQNSEGEEVSTLEVKQILTELIGEEEKRNPLSDDRLTQLLQEKGYNIARRTVAKYRDQLNIPKASLRKII
jgi:RNA polymerase sigma-54 factor